MGEFPCSLCRLGLLDEEDLVCKFGSNTRRAGFEIRFEDASEIENELIAGTKGRDSTRSLGVCSSLLRELVK